MNLRDQLTLQPVLPAPMCGISDGPFRAVCRAMGAAMTFTQMVASEGLVRGDLKSACVLDLGPEPEPLLAMQLFGAEAGPLAESCRWLEDRGAALIDLNMGCPARRVTCSRSGSALLRDLPRAACIFRAMRAATRVPLTVKMRWDWDEGDAASAGAALAAARIAEAEGLDGVCLHARTRQQGYSGQANWELIGRLKQAVAIPVIGNGDIRQPADALEMMRLSGCDAVMIGRALIGDPWFLRETLEAVRTGCAPAHRPWPSWDERRRMMLLHAGLMVQRHGARALIPFRKHAVAYLRGLAGGKAVRTELMQVRTMAGLEQVLAAHELAPAPVAGAEHDGQALPG
jgi:nifR3 family TIM-barrel protein